MLEFKDFFHLPQLDPLVDQLAGDGPGLVVVAGLEPRSLATPSETSVLPSGRGAIFRILQRQIVEAQSGRRAIVVARTRDTVRIPRQHKRQVEVAPVQGPYTYAGRIAEAIRRRPGLLVIDELCSETAGLALEAAQSGLRVLSQLDTVFHGADVALALLDLGAAPEQLEALRWVLTVQRLAALCPHCKKPGGRPAHLVQQLHAYAHLFNQPEEDEPAFFQPAGCGRCRHTGYEGEVTIFDVFRASGETGLSGQQSQLPQAEYAVRLAAAGHLALDDALNLDRTQLRRTYSLLDASERALRQANVALQSKLVELEAANRVLRQRTEALLSLHEIGQALISVIDLEELAHQVCRHAHELCGADYVILYYVRPGDTADILAFSGWHSDYVNNQVLTAEILDLAKDTGTEPVPFRGWPPGIAPGADADSAVRRTGLRVPLIVQKRPVGVMLVHTQRKAAFTPGEVSLLQTFAHQAALALQRAGLIASLQANLARLRAAQAELVQKERLEQELALARQVQQSMLPRVFPEVSGYTFAAANVPARQVGGDFYDVIPVGEEDVAVVIGDVSDKGMAAALYMALTRSLLQAEARRHRSPVAVLNNVHQLLLALGEANMFVTLFYGVIDTATRRLTYARAGHDRPLLLRGQSVHTLGGAGIALGLSDLADLLLTEEQVNLEPGDLLVLYTDGLTDALDSDGRLFDLEQLTAVFQKHAARPPDRFCQATFADVAAYQGNAEQFDDMTMLVVAVSGN